MNEDIQRWLDGELEDDALSPSLRAEAERWRQVLDAGARMEARAPSWIEEAVMRGLPPRRRSLKVRVADWWARPVTVRVGPLWASALVVVAIAMVLLWPAAPMGPVPHDTAATAVGTPPDGTVYVQFVYVAPAATSVSVAGDFNDWSETGFSLRDASGDGVWTGHVPLRPGLHKYMFVVDGEWVTDPRAERYVDDGFGSRNALVSVIPPRSEI